MVENKVDVSEINDVKDSKTYIRKSEKPRRLTKKEKKKLGLINKESKAILRYARISARKVKIVIDLIRNKRVSEALAILKNTPKAAAPIVEKLIRSAVANAENNHNLNVDNLYIAEIYANQGPTLKRIRARAQGRAFRIRKRTSHITVVLRERE